MYAIRTRDNRYVASVSDNGDLVFSFNKDERLLFKLRSVAKSFMAWADEHVILVNIPGGVA